MEKFKSVSLGFIFVEDPEIKLEKYDVETTTTSKEIKTWLSENWPSKLRAVKGAKDIRLITCGRVFRDAKMLLDNVLPGVKVHIHAQQAPVEGWPVRVRTSGRSDKEKQRSSNSHGNSSRSSRATGSGGSSSSSSGDNNGNRGSSKSCVIL